MDGGNLFAVLRQPCTDLAVIAVCPCLIPPCGRMDTVGQRPAGFREPVRHRLIRIRKCQTAVRAKTVGKTSHVFAVLASIECLNQCKVQRVDAHMKDTHAGTALIRIIRAGSAKADTDLAVREARFLIQQRINELFCLIHELLHLCFRAVKCCSL